MAKIKPNGWTKIWYKKLVLIWSIKYLNEMVIVCYKKGLNGFNIRFGY
jgi:hypothetical protein